MLAPGYAIRARYERCEFHEPVPGDPLQGNRDLRSEAMHHAARLVSLALATLPSIAAAQQLTLAPTTSTPGETVTGVLFNDTAGPLEYVRYCEVRTLRHSGELVHVSSAFASPRTVLPVNACDQTLSLAPGASRVFTFEAPDLPGSYTIISADLVRAAARLTVTAPAPDAQQLAFYPSGVWLPQTAHEVDFDRPVNTPWELANTGANKHVFGAADRVRILRPGPESEVASLALDGFAVPAGKVRTLTLPIEGLAPGPYRVEASFADPLAGAVVTLSGIQPRGAGVDLHLYDGRALERGVPLRVGISVTGFPVGGEDTFYYLLLGTRAGVTPLPGGVATQVLFGDPLVRSSYRSGLGGALVNHVGRVTNAIPPGNPVFAGGRDDLAIVRPLSPSLSGLVMEIAVLASDAGLTTWGASQPERVRLP